MDQERYRALLRSARPDLSPKRFDDLGAGWDNVVFVVDDERIVRFAKDARTTTMLETEAALLRAIGPSLSVPVPYPEFVARPPESPDIALMIYRRIPGVALDTVALDDALIAGIAPDLARFLDALHEIAAEELRSLEIPRFTADAWIERHQVLYRRTQADVRQGLSVAAFERYEAWWNDYLTNPASRAFEPCLIHGDLVLEHIVIEPDPWRLSGIIDFGDAMWADPALDLAGWPEPLVQAVVERLRSLTPDRAFWMRRDAYRRIAPLHAVLAGRDFGRPDLLRSGIEALRRLLFS
jgi:aminoglycoside phosphotransferase (APT) family kinase protein